MAVNYKQMWIPSDLHEAIKKQAVIENKSLVALLKSKFLGEKKDAAS